MLKYLPLLLSTVLVAGQDASPVKVHVYYETLCPYSRDFIVNQLYPTWTKVKEIMDVEMFPFGNAKFFPSGDGWGFKCQHGDDECKTNMIHACAKTKFNDINIEMEFIMCLLSSNYPPNAGAKCATQVNKDWHPIENCINGLEGQELLHQVGVQQQQLNPKLYFVPWIIVNDFFSEAQVSQCQQDLLEVVCSKYEGPNWPAECKDSIQAHMKNKTMANLA
ncbi:gamma-interferon-inducible lysosomal thiol reductase-like [Oratosquilla oratoria]|uniref:gamma-interferon-inducible lysosomal thiol reductase-like n=1 Tax=Oratosquilla oratoria TaxID=337810 RepID=UPI003F76156F